jgi:hypothetical protein
MTIAAADATDARLIHPVPPAMTMIVTMAADVVAGREIPGAIPRRLVAVGRNVAVSAARAAGTTMTIAACPPAVVECRHAPAGTTMIAAEAAGSAIRKAIPKPRAAAGMSAAAREAAPAMIVRIRPARVAMTMITDTVAGSAIRKAIPRQPAVAGTNAADPVAVATTMIAAARAVVTNL